MLEVARRGGEGYAHNGGRACVRHRRVEDVRRFFQSPVDAAPGTVVVVNTAAIARRSAAGYHHRTFALDAHPADNSLRWCPRVRATEVAVDKHLTGEDTARWRIPGRREREGSEGGGGGGAGGGGSGASVMMNRFSATRFTCSSSET